MVHYAAADFEVREHLQRVDRAGSGLAGRLDQFANLGNERRQTVAFPLWRLTATLRGIPILKACDRPGRRLVEE